MIKDLSAQKKVEEILKLAREISTRTELQDIRVATTIVVTLGTPAGQYWGEAVGVLERLKAARVKLDPVLYSIAIDNCCKAQQFDEAFRLFDDMQRDGLTPMYSIFDALLRVSNSVRRSDKITELVQKMKDLGVRITPQVYHLAVGACSKTGDNAQAVDLYRRVFPQDCLQVMSRPSAIMLHDCVLRAKEYDELRRLTLDLLAQNANLSRKSCMLSIRSFVSVGDSRTARRLLDMALKGCGPPPNPAAITKAGPQGPRQFFPHASIFGMVMGAYLRSQDYIGAFEFSKYMARLQVTKWWADQPGCLTMLADTLGGLALALMGARYHKECLQTVLDMRAMGLMPSNRVWAAGMYAAVQKEDHRQALQLFEDMQRAGAPPEKSAFVSAMAACNKLEDYPRTLQLLDQSEAAGIQLNTAGYNVAINACAKTANFDRAMEIVLHMKATGVRMYEGTFMVALEAAARAAEKNIKSKHLDKALDLLRMSLKEDWPPSERSFGFAMCTLGWQGKVQEALKLLREMQGLGLPCTQHSYGAVLIGCRQSGDVRAMLDIWKEMRSNGLTPDNHNFCAALATCRKGGDWRAAIELLDQADVDVTPKAQGAPTLEMMYTITMDTCGKSGHPDEALQVFQRMQSKGLQPNAYTYSALISALAAKSRFPEVLQVLDMMERTGVEPTVITYTSAMGSGTSTEQNDAMMGLMRAKGLKPNNLTLTLMMQGYQQQGQTAKALELLRQAREDGLWVNTIVCNACLRVLAKAGNVQKARELLQEMTKEAQGGRDCAPTITSFNIAIDASAKAGDWAMAMGLISEMRQAGFEPDTISYNCAIDACNVSANAETALLLLDQMRQSGLAPDEFSYSSALTACRRAKQTELAEKLLREMRQDGLEPCELQYGTVISTAGQKGDWRTALALLEEMRRENTPVGGYSLSCAIAACARGGNHKEAVKLLEEMQNADLPLPPSRYCYNAVVQACSRAGDVAASLRVKEQMRAAGVEPDLTTYTSLLLGVAAETPSNWELADQLLEEMKAYKVTLTESCWAPLIVAAARGGEPDRGLEYLKRMQQEVPGANTETSLYAKLAGAYAKARRFPEIMGILELMRSNGQKPTRYVYNTAISQCSRESDCATLETLMEDMKGDGYRPDSFTYSCATSAYARAVRTDDVCALMEEAAKEGGPLTTHHMNFILDGYIRGNHLQDARRVLAKMESMKMELNSMSYNPLLTACLDADDLEGARQLVDSMKDQNIFPDAAATAKLNAAPGREPVLFP